jgi:UDP-N-acetylglucosamine 1-carboxyvinyltransferase
MYIIRGGNPIQGEIVPAGNKNAALPLLAASLLTDQPVVLDNVPAIRDVQVMLELLGGLGAEVERVDRRMWRVTARSVDPTRIDPALCRQIRASFLLAGPLLARFRRAELPRPGGDRIGRRPLDPHIHALCDLGAEIEMASDRCHLTAPAGLVGREVFLHEMSVMATENTVMAAAGARGTTVIDNAASEPHVQELCRFLISMGVEVEGVGTNRLVVHGSETAATEPRPASTVVGPDYIEIGSFIVLAAVTGGQLRIRDAQADRLLRMPRIAFERLGIRWEADGDDIVVPASQELKVVGDLHGGVAKIDDGPWPAFPADLTSIALVAATQAAGTFMIHEKMFESRLFWVDRLIAMGARIVICDPHRALVVGPSPLYGTVMSSPDIRAGMALVIAALCGQGESRIHNVHQVERGYEALDERLRALGADIQRVE